MKHLLVITLQIALVPGTVHAEDEWTSQAALEEIHPLITKRISRSEMRQRNDNIATWLKKVDERGMDFGEQSFVVGLAHYFVRDATAANNVLIDYLKKYRKFPASDYDRHLGRVLLGTTGSAVSARDFRTVELTLPFTLTLGSNRKLAYHRIGGSLRRADGPQAHKILNDLIRSLLREPDFSDTDKQKVLEGLYGRGATSSRTMTPSALRSTAMGPRPFRPFTAADLDGKQLSVADYKGKVLLVDFWATWCGPCLLEMPNVVATYKNYHKRGFEIIGVSLDRAGEESRLRSVMKRFGVTWRQIYDGKAWRTKIAVMNGVRRIPTTYLLDRTGKVRYTNLRGKALEEKVTELLKEKPPAGQ